MSMDQRLSDRIVLITGGTGALGSVVTKRLLDKDCTVITTYIDPEEYDTLQETVGEDADLTGYRVDVMSGEQVDGLVDKIIEQHGRIDILLNIVGAWKGGNPLHETDEDTWDAMLDVNLKSAFLVSTNVLPHMRDNGFGRIISIGSKTGNDLPAEGGPYAIAKHGVEALTTIMAKENSDRNITANCILPSVIDTAANREAMGTENVDKWVQPEEIAEKIISLIQDPDTTGESIELYGGLG